MNKVLIASAIAVACLSVSLAASAADSTALPSIKQTKFGLYLDSAQAYRMKEELKDKALLVDVRTRYELAYVGTPTVVDVHIPYVEHPFEAGWDDKNGRFVLEPNGDFGPELARRLAAKGLGKADPVILLCRSGDRSARAANLLKDLGYEKVYSVVDGFEGDLAKDGANAGKRMVNGWKNAGLPWTYRLDKDKLYFSKY